MMDSVELLNSLGCATTARELYLTARTFADAHQFPHFLFAIRIPKPPGPAVHFVVSGYPPGWRALYDQREYVRIDPIVHHAFQSAMPVIWDEVRRDTPLIEEFFAEAAAHGLVHGISAPIYSRRGEMAVFSLARIEPIAANAEERLALKQSVQWFATAFNETALRLPQAEQRLDKLEVPRLSPRERQCVSLAHEGKRNAEIAYLMGITERTVLAHFEAAGQKLGVSGRHQIVARAVCVGEVEPSLHALQADRLPPISEYATRH